MLEGISEGWRLFVDIYTVIYTKPIRGYRLTKRPYPTQMKQSITINHIQSLFSWPIKLVSYFWDVKSEVPRSKFWTCNCKNGQPKITHEFDWSRSKWLNVICWFICISIGHGLFQSIKKRFVDLTRFGCLDTYQGCHVGNSYHNLW